MDGVLLPETEKASSRESDVSSSSINLHDDEVNRWLFSREEIENNSPSRRDGIDLKTETQLRMSYCAFLQAFGERFKLKQITVATAIVLCHRFFIRQSHAKNDRWIIATICMFLASKVEQPLLTSDACITACHEIRNKTKLDAAQRKEVYEQQKELILSGEKLVLSTLNFHLSVFHPYVPLAKAIMKVTIEDAKPQLSKLSLDFVKNCLRTTLYLQYKPQHIAAAAFFFSAQHMKLDVKSYGGFFRQEFGITYSQLKDIHGQMRQNCDKKHVHTLQGNKVETSDGGDTVQQPVSRDIATKDTCSSSDIEGGSTKVNQSQSDDHSDQDGSRPEGTGEKNSESEAGENQDDHSAPTVSETSDDVVVSQLKDLKLHPKEVKSEPEKDEEPSFD